MRTNARIRLLNVRAYAAYFKSEPTCIAMMHGVVEVCTKHRSHMNIASVNTLLIFTELARREKEIDLAILQPRSPTCGVRQIYDGTFTGTRIDGQGLLAQALAQRGIPLMDAAEVPE